MLTISNTSSHSYGRRGMSLDRSRAHSRAGAGPGGGAGLGYSQSMSRAHSQNNLGASSRWLLVTIPQQR